MPPSAIPLLSQYLRRLAGCPSDPSTDHELLQRFITLHDESAFCYSRWVNYQRGPFLLSPSPALGNC
jgi:hypothetical protein